MGLISWIKNKYYDSRLNSADKLCENHDYAAAQSIYESLLSKQPFADAHLAGMLVANASSVSGKLEVLKRLISLREYENEASKSDFDSIFNKHVASMESLAASSFSRNNYSDAVTLMSSIKNFRRGKTFDDTLNKYRAYLSFENEERKSLSSANLFTETVNYLSQISTFPESDAKQMVASLEKQKKYSRNIKFLLQLLNVGTWVKDSILNSIVEIIINNDSELKNVKTFKDFCSDKSVCKESAIDLSKRARVKAQKRDYRSAVLYDSFAAEYLSDDNEFNFERCKYILEELSNRAEVAEVKNLQKLAKTLKLSDSQIAQLDRRTREIATAATPAKGLAICKLYIGNPDFDKVYFEKAGALAKNGANIDLSELRIVIANQTNDETLPNVLASFVPYLPALENEFVAAAIKAIKKSNSTDLLDKYWKVKNDTRFIESFINKKYEGWKTFAAHIADNRNLYLDKNIYLDVFCKSLRNTEDLAFILDISEKLLKANKDVLNFYISEILKYAKSASTSEDAIDLVNRGLIHVKKDKSAKLLSEKKNLISRLISENKLDRAELEIKSIIETDEEATTLLAELYYKRAELSGKITEKIEWLYKVLDVNEQHTLYDRFNISLQETLTLLSNIAKELCKSGEKVSAFSIADRISSYSAHWILLYVWLRTWDNLAGLGLNDRIKHYAETLKTIASKCPTCKEYDSELFRGEWDSYTATTIRKAQSQPKDKAIDALTKLKKAVNSFAPTAYAATKDEELTKLIVKLKWDLANEYEHECNYSGAIKLYDEVANDKVQSYVNRAELRSLICHVKANDVNSVVENRISESLKLRSYEALREDLAYRFACYLLENTRPSDAENILREFLPDEQMLLDMCENIYVKEAEQKLAEFNSLLSKLNEGKMSVAEAVDLKNAIREYKKQIAGKLTDTSRKFAGIVPKVEAYILRKMFEEEAYSALLSKLMAENPNYIENDVDFRNIAIASLGIIESDIEDESILKRAIATVLTAIYSDRLFVQSLDYTSWDDKFTFTLEGSLGQTNGGDYDELPENVNFDYPIDNVNVAIRDVQNSLLTRVETSVRKYHPELEKFCNEEKDALDKIIGLNLDKDYILASPQLCRTLASIRMSIENAFAHEIEQDYGNQEDVIALGTIYGFSGREYDEYTKGANALRFCKSALSPRPAVTVTSAFASDKVTAIKRFNRLFSNLKSSVGTEMNNDIRSEMDFKKFLDKYEPVCKAIGDTTLSLTCSNYVNGEVVHLLNEDKMQLRDGVGYMVRIYNIASSNFQVKKNLEGILCGLAIKAEESGSSADRAALNKAVSDTGSAFRTAVEDATIQAKLSVIVDKVNSNRMKKNSALTEVYKLYEKNRDNERICENLVTLCEMCIFEYIIKDAYGSAGVKNTLNSLQNNMSSTFKRKATSLAKSYNEIWGQLPANTRMLIQGMGGYGETLNDKGYALKAGLNYLKTLGSVNTARRGGLFGDIDLPF